MVVEKERVSLLGVGDLVVPPSAGAATAVVIAEREHMRTARVVSHVGILYRVAQVGGQHVAVGGIGAS